MSDSATPQATWVRWRALQTELDRARQGELPIEALAATFRRDTGPLLAALPPNFGTVLHPLLDRMESAAGFTEESCAVSQRDLLDSLAFWLERARVRLESGTR